MRLARHTVCTAAFLLAALVPTLATADNVLPGYDLFATDPTSTYQDFSGTPIPAGFFDPGSDPFTGTVRFGGLPLVHNPVCPADNLTTVDTIVQRLATANVTTIPSSDTIPIEIVALNLVSVNPITVTYSGGFSPELWNVQVVLSPSLPQPMGSMTIHHTIPTGGTFDSTLPVVPMFIFQRVGDGALRYLDLGLFPIAIQFSGNNVPWAHTVAPAGSCTSNFCVNPGSLTTEQSMLAAHGVLSVCPSAPTPTRAATWGILKVMYR